MLENNNELLDVYGEDGLETGEVMPRSEIHKHGILHKTTHIWLLNDAGHLLLQLRSLNKVHDPGKWAIPGGHVNTQEESKISAARELFEEMGIDKDPDELIYLGTVRDNKYLTEDFTENQMIDVYVTASSVEAEDVRTNNEVSGAKYFSLIELERVYAGEDPLFALRPDSFSLIKEYIYGPGQN